MLIVPEGSSDGVDADHHGGEVTINETNIIIFAGSVAAGLLLVAVFAILSSARSFAIFTLILSVLTIIMAIVNVFTFFGIPASILTAVATCLSVPGSAIVACACKCCDRSDGKPGGHIACAILCCLAVLVRVGSIGVAIPFSLVSLFTVFTGLIGLTITIAALNMACVIVTAISGAAELVLCVKCLIHIGVNFHCHRSTTEVNVPVPLPPGYTSHYDDVGRRYFHNQEMRTSTYEDPRPRPTNPPPPPPPPQSPLQTSVAVESVSVDTSYY